MSRDAHGFDENYLLEGERELWRNSQWRVTTIALEEVPGGGGYWIPVDAVHDEMWPEHMAMKRWVDHGAFMQALAKARELFPQAVPA